MDEIDPRLGDVISLPTTEAGDGKWRKRSMQSPLQLKPVRMNGILGQSPLSIFRQREKTKKKWCVSNSSIFNP